MFFDSVAGDKDHFGSLDHLVAKDTWLARQAAQVLQTPFNLVNLNVLEPSQRIHVPVGADWVVLTLGVLNQVHLQFYFCSLAFRDQQRITEVAQNVAIVRLADRRVIKLFLVELEVYVGVRRHKFCCHYKYMIN